MTTSNNPQYSTSDILNKLNNLSSEFTKAAETKSAPDLRVAKTLEAAAQALKAEQAKRIQLQEELNALKAETALKQANLKGKRFNFLVDGSGSMGAPTGMCKPSPLKIALDGIEVFAQTVRTSITAALWGDLKVQVITDRVRAEKGLNSGSDFAPAVDYMRVLASATKKPQHFVVVGDGDIHDMGKTQPKANSFLTACPHATLDFVVINDNGGFMKTLAEDLHQRFPNQVSLQIVNADQPIDTALLTIASMRAPKAKKKADPKPK